MQYELRNKEIYLVKERESNIVYNVYWNEINQQFKRDNLAIRGLDWDSYHKTWKCRKSTTIAQKLVKTIN